MPGITDQRNYPRMSVTHVVSDASLLSNLSVISRLELLREQFETVWIPPAVLMELARFEHPEAKSGYWRVRRKAGSRYAR